jgi:hypothetical protein
MLKRLSLPVFGLILGLSCPLLSQMAHAEQFTIDMNKTHVLNLPVPAGAVVVGNPEIADVSVHSPNTLFVLARGYGETNIVVLDNSGQIILETDIVVRDSTSAGNIRLYRVGLGRQSYTCAPQCLPAPKLGDDRQFTSLNKGKNINITNSTITAALTTPTGVNIQSLQASPFFGSDGDGDRSPVSFSAPQSRSAPRARPAPSRQSSGSAGRSSGSNR